MCNFEEEKRRIDQEEAEKGQGSEAETASLKRVKAESVRDLGMLQVMIWRIWGFFEEMKMRRKWIRIYTRVCDGFLKVYAKAVGFLLREENIKVFATL